MIVFGLFSTHLPYVILIVLYGMYFILSLNGRKNEIPEFLPPDEIKSVSADENVNDNELTENTFYYQDFFIEVNAPHLPDKPDYFTGFIIIEKSGRINCSQLLTCHVYCNPPPSC